MTPAPYPTLSERATELEIAAKVARELGNLVFANELALHAQCLRQKEALCGQKQEN